MSGLDIASGAVGIASLGIEVCQRLITYYHTWKDYSSDIRDAYDALIDLSKPLGLLKASLKRDELNKERVERVQACLESCEDALVELCKKLQELQKHKTPEGLRQKLLWKGQQVLYPFRSKTLEKLQQNVNEIRERLNLALQDLQLDVIIHLEASMAQMTTQNELLLAVQQSRLSERFLDDRNKRANEFLKQLRTNAYDYVEAKARNDEPLEGTCQWFVGNKLFRDWSSTADIGFSTSPFLYVTADPGCGKSVLTRHLVENVLPQKGRTVCYSFFKSDFEDQKGSLRAANALLHQLLIAYRYLLTEDETIHERSNAYGDEFFISFTVIWETFTLASRLSRNQVVCVLDALDECREADRKQLLKAIGRERGSSIKVLFTSRPYDDIRRGVLQLHKEDLPLIHLQGDQGVTAKEIEDEIQLVIEYRINKISKDVRLSSAERYLLQRQLGSVPNRNYLWITLVFDGLIGQHYITKKDIMNLGNNLPDGLPEAYQKILAKSRDMEKTRKLLHIMLAAHRPLTTFEMAAALAINGQRSWAEVEDEMIPEDRMNESIRDLCGLFVTIVDGNVYFLHETAREFLTRDHQTSSAAIERLGNLTDDIVAIVAHGFSLLFLFLLRYLQAVLYFNISAQTPAWLHSIDLAESDATLAAICISHLLLGRNEQTESSYADPLKAKQHRPMYKYAAKFWLNHYRKSSDAFQEAAAERAQGVCSLYPGDTYLTKVYRPHKYPVRGPPLCLAAAFGLERVVTQFLRSQDPSCNLVNITDDQGRSPISWAVQHGYEQIVRLLIRCGADLDLSDAFGKTPILYAISGGRRHEDLVRLSIDSNANIDLWDMMGESPLCLAACEIYKEIGRLLMERGASINIRDMCGWTPLSLAASLSHQEMTRVLIDAGANKDLPDGFNETPLLCAIDRAHEGVARLLIEAGANTDLATLDGWTPLLLAAVKGQEGVARLLIKVGADINLATQHGWTPLSLAAKKGREGVVRSLLGCTTKTLVNLPDNEGRTPLSWAVTNRHEGVARLLIKGGASLDLIDDYGRIPLLWAETEGFEDVMRSLFEGDVQ